MNPVADPGRAIPSGKNWLPANKAPVPKGTKSVVTMQMCFQESNVNTSADRAASRTTLGEVRALPDHREGTGEVTGTGRKGKMMEGEEETKDERCRRKVRERSVRKGVKIDKDGRGEGKGKAKKGKMEDKRKGGERMVRKSRKWLEDMIGDKEGESLATASAPISSPPVDE